MNDWLAPRNFNIEVDGHTIGGATMSGGAPQGSPLLPALFTVYMSSVVWETKTQRDRVRTLRQERRVS